MKSTLTFLALVILLTACGHHVSPPEDQSPDSQLRKKLIGTWTIESILQLGREMTNVTSQSQIILSTNGSYESRFTNLGTNYAHDFSYAGTWLVTNGEIHSTITNSSLPKAVPIGTSYQLKIIRADTDEIVWNDSKLGQTIHLKRVKVTSK